MNWLGDLVQKEITGNDSVSSLGCGVLQEVMGLRCKSFVGFDIYEPYINKIKLLGVNAICADITKYEFGINTIDVVIALDILEHLDFKEAYNLIKKMKRMARKKVIIYTPSHFFDNININWLGQKNNIFEWMENSPDSDWKGTGINKYQEHKCFIPDRVFKKFGFKTSTDNIDKNTYAIWENK